MPSITNYLTSSAILMAYLGFAGGWGGFIPANPRKHHLGDLLRHHPDAASGSGPSMAIASKVYRLGNQPGHHNFICHPTCSNARLVVAPPLYFWLFWRPYAVDIGLDSKHGGACFVGLDWAACLSNSGSSLAPRFPLHFLRKAHGSQVYFYEVIWPERSWVRAPVI